MIVFIIDLLCANDITSDAFEDTLTPKVGTRYVLCGRLAKQCALVSIFSCDTQQIKTWLFVCVSLVHFGTALACCKDDRHEYFLGRARYASVQNMIMEKTRKSTVYFCPRRVMGRVLSYDSSGRRFLHVYFHQILMRFCKCVLTDGFATFI